MRKGEWAAYLLAAEDPPPAGRMYLEQGTVIISKWGAGTERQEEFPHQTKEAAGTWKFKKLQRSEAGGAATRHPD